MTKPGHRRERPSPPPSCPELSRSEAKIADFGVDEVPRRGETLVELVRGEWTGVLVRGVFPPEAIARLADRLERHFVPSSEAMVSPRLRVRFIGQCLDVADPSLKGYFEKAAEAELSIRQAFDGIGDFRARAASILGGLYQGRQVEVPEGPDGRPYALATMKRFKGGGYLPPHCEREQATRPPYGHLRDLIVPDTMLSYYLMIQPPESGGELCVSTLRWADIDASKFENGRSRVDDLMSARPHAKLAPEAGDIVIIDGGSRFHWVAPCGGRRSRWTIGGFVSPERGGPRLFTWS